MGNVRQTGYKQHIIPYHAGKHYTIVGFGAMFHLRYMVAETWVPNTQSRKCVRHINGDTHDNRAANLEWYTPLIGRPKKQTWDTMSYPDDPGSVHTLENNTINKTFIIYQIPGTSKWTAYNTLTNQTFPAYDSREEAEKVADL